MTMIEQLRDTPVRRDDGFGALRTERGNLPLHRLDVRASITGLDAGIEVTQGFRNPYDAALEATYVFPLPDRAALTGMRLTAGDRVIEGVLRERGAARREYDAAMAAGQRASIAEEDRPDVFTLRVGNILPGEQVTVTLTLAGPLSLVDGQAEFRFPLVVAPRYIPGSPLPGAPVGDGYAADTDATPDASRITPPILLPGFPNPVDLSVEVRVDPAGLPLRGLASSLHAVTTTEGVVRIEPGERVDRDFILRLDYGADDDGEPAGRDGGHALVLSPDADGAQGTYQLTVLPPRTSATGRPKDLVLLLDRSGSMGGWKMVAARRAAARIVDTLTDGDRFAVLTFDHDVERPPSLDPGLVAATDRHRYRAVEHLAGVTARGGTELLAPLAEGLRLLTGGPVEPARDRVLVLITDGQVGNEDQILRELSAGLAGVRIHAVGIDRAVNAGFLGRLAVVGSGRCELVESEDRLDEAMQRIHRRIGAPLVTDVRIAADGLRLLDGTATPARTPDLFPGVPLVVRGRYEGSSSGTVTVSGTDVTGGAFHVVVPAALVTAPALAAIWARSHLRDLEDRYVVSGGDRLESEVVDTSLRFGVLCRFTAYVAVDTRVVNEGGEVHRVIQPVELPSGWEPRGMTLAAGASPMSAMAAPMAMPAAGSVRLSHTAARPRAGKLFGAKGDVAAPAAPAGATPPAAPDLTSAGPDGTPRFPAPSGIPTPPGVPGRPGIPAPPTIPGPPSIPVPPGVPAPPGRPVPAPSPGGITVAQIAAQEAHSLRAAATEPEHRQRDLLDDLASRLDALVRYLTAGEPADALRALVVLLRDGSRPVAERWSAALSTLDTLAASRASTEDTGPDRRRGAFWRRG
jgi:Ca-activated chloride channel family protein